MFYVICFLAGTFFGFVGCCLLIGGHNNER